MNDLTNLIEWNKFAHDKKTVLEVLTILNNRHRDAIEAGFGQRKWHYSDLLLANLQLVCECNGCPQFITQARELTKVALKA